MQINSNIEYLNKIKQTSLAAKYPQLISTALMYTLLQRRAKHLDGPFHTWFPWKKTKEGHGYWIVISRNL